MSRYRFRGQILLLLFGLAACGGPSADPAATVDAAAVSPARDGGSDSGEDAGSRDAGVPDAGMADAGLDDAGARDGGIRADELRVVGAGPGAPIWAWREDGTVVATATADSRGEASIQVPDGPVHVAARAPLMNEGREYVARTDVEGGDLVDLGRPGPDTAAVFHFERTGRNLVVLGACLGGWIRAERTSPLPTRVPIECTRAASHLVLDLEMPSLRYARLDTVEARPVEFRAGPWMTATDVASVRIVSTATSAIVSGPRYVGPNFATDAWSRIAPDGSYEVDVPPEPQPIWLGAFAETRPEPRGDCSVMQFEIQGLPLSGGTMRFTLRAPVTEAMTVFEGPGALQVEWETAGTVAAQQLGVYGPRTSPARTWIAHLPGSRRTLTIPEVEPGALPDRGGSLGVSSWEEGPWDGYAPPGAREAFSRMGCPMDAR